jgi:hypothetical protein
MKQIYQRYTIILSVIAALWTSCEKNQHPVPIVNVNFTINLDLPSYQPLINPGGVAYSTYGSRGIIIYRNFDEFVALDRHSTYNSEDPCAVVDVNPDNQFELIDTCSGSRFAIYSGAVVHGPAEYALRRYYAQWDGASTVHIYN